MDIRPSIFAWTLTCSLAVSGVAFSQESRTKVILDADMVELFDDGTAMLLLERAPNIDLLGVTVVSGNTPMPAGVAAGVRQLEALGSDVPIYEGSRYGIRNWRGNKATPEVLAAELQISPITGWGGYLRPDAGSEIDADPTAKWSDVYKHKYGEAPSYKRVYGLDNPDPDGNRDAVDFLVDTVNKYPGQVKLVAIGHSPISHAPFSRTQAFRRRSPKSSIWAVLSMYPEIRQRRRSSTGGPTLKPPRSASGRNGAIQIPKLSRRMEIR